MGALRFALHPPELAEQCAELRLAYISGMDRMPWRTRAEAGDGYLVCSRGVPESGVLNVPWPVADFGRVVLRSATLRERPEPYHLQVELARGKVNQLRNQLAEWELLGLRVPEATRAEMRAVQHELSRTLTSQATPLDAARLADGTLAQALETAEGLVRLYADQVYCIRHQQYPQLNTLLSCRIAPGPAGLDDAGFAAAFNSVSIPFAWKDVEPAEGEYAWEPYDRLVDWCTRQRLVIRGGPLLQWSPHALPDWLWLWEHDFANLLSFASDFVETVIARYRGRIRLWDVTSRTNCSEALSLGEEDRMRLTVRALRVAREADPEAVYLVTLGQPWGEYMARREYQYSPLHFADALLRADLGLSGLGLELIMGYEGGASYCRDLLEISALLDQYALLGVPLHVLLAAPSGRTPDPRASSGWDYGGGSWRGEWGETTQADWIDAVLQLAGCKPYVQEVGFSHFSDSAPHELPLAGLVRSDGSPKPSLARVVEFRQRHLR